MNIINELKKVFQFDESEIDDRISTFRLEANLSVKPEIDNIRIKALLQGIPEYDILKLTLKVEELDSISFLSNDYSSSSFIDEFEESFRHYERGEKITLNIEIDKSTINEAISIYSFDSLKSFVSKLNHIQFLNLLTNVTDFKKPLNFKFLESSLYSFKSEWISFGYDFDSSNPESKIELIEANCNFSDIKKYQFTPNHFEIKYSVKEEGNPIIEKIKTLKGLFSLISIFDLTKLDSEKVEYRLNGYKTQRGAFLVDENLTSKSANYFELYEWIYSSTGNIADKIGIARNLISLNLKNDGIEIDSQLISSVKSAYQIYLKENVANYLTLRSNILDELSWISQKSSDIIQDYLKSYKQSTFSILSFFISVFLLRALKSGEFSKVFTKDVTIIALVLIALSIVYMLFERNNVLGEVKRLIRKYDNTKKRYKDLLLEDDIIKILSNDEEFDYEKETICKRLFNYTLLWSISLFFLALSIFLLSELNPYSFFHD